MTDVEHYSALAMDSQNEGGREGRGKWWEDTLRWAEDGRTVHHTSMSRKRDEEIARQMARKDAEVGNF